MDFSPSSGHTSALRPGRRGQGRAAQGAPEKVSLPDSARMSRRTSRGRLRSLPGECTEEPHRRLHPLSFPWWTGLSDYPASPRMRLKCVLRGERDGRRAACWWPRRLRLAVGPSPPPPGPAPLSRSPHLPLHQARGTQQSRDCALLPAVSISDNQTETTQQPDS